MTRKEKIEKAAIEYCSGNKGADARVRTAFLVGALWADETMLDKVCKWLDENMADRISIYEDYDVHYVVVSDYAFKKEFIGAFRKAMENEHYGKK